MPDERDAALFAVRRDLAAHGVASPADLGRGICGPSAVSQALAELTESGDVTPVVIEGLEEETHYALTRSLEQTARRAVRQPPVHVVSPFDSLVIRRWRVAKLFGFDYKLECYLPAPQRRHGYFCLPILRGDRFIGRLDPKADRETGTLFVRSAVFERGFDEYDEMLPGLAGRLRAFARFNACDRVIVEQTSPRKARIPLIRCLRDAGIM